MDASLRIDLAWMLRTGRAKEGCIVSGTLHWNCGGEPSGSISYRALMDKPGEERLELSYCRGIGDQREQLSQTIRLCNTQPHFGGKRWWMICPFRGNRVSKLAMPPGGDRFASRQAWRLGYQSQRNAARDRPFNALFKLQARLGCTQGWEQPIRRPKGMWRRTYARLEARYWNLDARCAVEMIGVLGRFGGFQLTIK